MMSLALNCLFVWSLFRSHRAGMLKWNIFQQKRKIFLFLFRWLGGSQMNVTNFGLKIIVQKMFLRGLYGAVRKLSNAVFCLFLTSVNNAFF